MAKGADFERDTCKKLSLWWTNGSNDAVFWRSSNSGGRFTVRRKAGKHTHGQAGDIAATDPIGEPFLRVATLELKRGYKDCNVHDVIDKMPNHKPPKFEAWLEQVRSSSTGSASFSWMLITKRDRRSTLIWMPQSLYQCLRAREASPKVVAELRCGNDLQVVGCNLEQWLIDVRPVHFMRIYHFDME